MAKPKRKVMVRFTDAGNIWVYVTEKPSSYFDDVNSIEGVTQVHLWDNCLEVRINPCYDKAEIAQEIEDLLKAEVPDVFRED